MVARVVDHGHMAYSDVALLAQDIDFTLRTTACVAIEPDTPDDPQTWAIDHMWDMAAQPGFGEAYGFAVANELPRPGNDASVISDAQILAAVQAITALEP